ncbi:DMT family transporter [Aquibaculum arenosum]|uniref:DMT family transporter n=1 Tax=Aquibaculum arenosum TaxID=3032591 RepID=A0ABT5YN29_9PROT|nr:DMT family transporter [Fodinicurvata sp. CAU 1616]MDF2096349.1 DMT family transporter [Fodinicurvata sp. CAU 1616]
MPSGNRDNLLLGIAAMLLGMLLMTMMDATAKWLGEGYPISQIVFFRNLFALPPILVVTWASGGLSSLRTRQWKLHLLRGFAILLAIYTFFWGLRFLPLADAIALAFLAPLFVSLLSIPLLGEKVGPRRWAAVGVGFVGMLVMLRPGAEVFRWEALLPTATAFGYALAMILTRRLSREDSNASIIFWGTLVGCLFSAAFLPFAWRTPPLIDFALLAMMGMVGSVSMYCMTVAYRSAPAAVIAPFEYTALLWGLLIGWLVWSELPDAWVWTGAAVIVGSGIYILHREQRIARKGRAGTSGG